MFCVCVRIRLSHWAVVSRVLLVRAGKVVLACLVLAWCLFVNAFVAGWFFLGDRVSFTAGQSEYAGLPESASDIDVYRNENFTGMFLADFSIGEAAFREFAEVQGWPLAEIRVLEQLFVAQAYYDGAENPRTVITSGLYFSERGGNGGGITVAFDRRVSRAYIASSRR